MRKRKAAEFFAGIGLVRLALENAGWRVVFANDISPLKFQMYREYFGQAHFYPCPIADIGAPIVPDVELATASFPCIDVSLAGNRAGLNGRHSSTYWEFHRILKELKGRKPPRILLENVTGLLHSNRGQDLRQIIDSLGKLGYYCDVLVVDALHFVPQSRPRLFVSGTIAPSRNALRTPEPHEARPSLVLKFIKENFRLNWAHCPLPPLPAKKTNLDDYLERFNDSGPEWWDFARKTHLYSQMSPLHRDRLRQLARSDQVRFATVYRRVRPAGCRAELRTDGVAGCLRTPRGGSSKQFVVQAGMGGWKVRNMTPREYARLQGVPDSFRIPFPYNQALLGFGDAVCVPVVEWVVASVFNPRRNGSN